MLSRKALRSDVIEFYVLSENESVVSSIKKATERLAELARVKASPLLKVNAPELVLSKSGDATETSFAVHMAKYFLWENGFDLGLDGYNIKKYLPKNNSYL